jgi:DNA-binding NtrC family response regulator
MNRRLLVVDDDASIRETLAHHLGRAGFEITTAESAERALSMFVNADPGVVITDVRMPGMTGIELVERLRELVPDVNVIVITAYEDMRTAIGAIRAGAYDYLVKPLDLDRIELVVDRAFRDRALRQRVKQVADDEAAGFEIDTLVGRSPKMIEIYKRIGALASTRTPVLIRGESGTGKEVIARAIHFNSDAAREPFVAVNCTAVPEPLLESELFGHVRGAFTGAISDRRGRFELAGRGSIFLDEIGDVSPAFQAKLLRVLQEREFQPVGGEKARRSEARVIAATHAPMEDRVRAGTFREDLYFRLRVVELVVPPLRERREDIPLLVEQLARRLQRDMHRAAVIVTPAALRLLQGHDWPGNIRELENAIARAVALSPSGVLTPNDFQLDSQSVPKPDVPTGEVDTLASAVRRHIEVVLRHTDGNKRAAARILRISRPRLDRLLSGDTDSKRSRDGNET